MISGIFILDDMYLPNHIIVSCIRLTLHTNIIVHTPVSMLAVSGQNCPTKGTYYSNIQTTQYAVTSGDHKLKKEQSIRIF